MKKIILNMVKYIMLKYIQRVKTQMNYSPRIKSKEPIDQIITFFII